MRNKVLCLLVGFIFLLNTSISFSYPCVEDMGDFIINNTPEYNSVIDNTDLSLIEEKYDVDVEAGVIFVTDDDRFFAFPCIDEFTIVIYKESTGELKIISPVNITEIIPDDAQSACAAYLFCILFTWFIAYGIFFIPCLILYASYCM